MYRYILAALALLAFALRAYHLNFQSLWRDEVDAVIFATQNLRGILGMFTGVGENGPLYFLSLHDWIALAGKSEFAIRFPSAVFGALAVLLTFQLGREVLGRQIGLIGAFLLAVSPYHIWYSQEAKMYAIISFLAPLSLLILLRAMRGGPRWLWLAWALLMGAFLYIHFFALMMVLVALVWLPLLLRNRPRLTLPLAAAVIVMALAILPVARWLVPAALTPAVTGYYPYTLDQMVVILFYNFSMGLRPASGPWPVVVFVILLAAGILPLVFVARSPSWPKPRAVLLLALYLLTPLLAIWLVSLRRPTFTDRYLIITQPAYCLLLAAGIVVLGEIVRLAIAPRPVPEAGRGAAALKNRRVAATRAGMARFDEVGAAVPQIAQSSALVSRLAVAALLVLMMALAVPFIWQQSHSEIKADFRAATAYLVDNASSQDLVIFLMPYVQRSFAYYNPEPVRTVDPPYTKGMSAAEVGRIMRGLVAGSERVWLFLSEDTFWDPDGLIKAWFDGVAVKRCDQEFTYIEVRCYDMLNP